MSSRILIADDERNLVAFLEKGLRANGFTTTVVMDGQEAAIVANDDDFDLLILDLEFLTAARLHPTLLFNHHAVAREGSARPTVACSKEFLCWARAGRLRKGVEQHEHQRKHAYTQQEQHNQGACSTATHSYCLLPTASRPLPTAGG